MSVVYQNPFGKKAYQPEVDGERRWWTYDRVSGRGVYVWATEGTLLEPDLRSRRSAARVERRRRRHLESVKRNTWEEVRPTTTTTTTPSVGVNVDAAVTAMNRYYSHGGYISTRTAFLHGLRAAGIPTTEEKVMGDE